MKLSNLKELRKRKGMSREDLAAKSGVSARAIENLELGMTNTREAKLGTLLDLAEALGVKVRALLPDEWGKRL